MANPVIKIKRSAVAGKIPTTTSLELGELAINTYDGKVYIQQDQVGIGSTVIAINPWSVGVGSNTYNTYFTAGNVGIGSTIPLSALSVVGDGNFSGVVTATSFYGDGSNLTGISAGAGIGTEDSINTTGIITASAFYGDGSNITGISAVARVSVQSGSPPSPVEGDLWYHTTLGRLFVYYSDTDSSQWIDAAPFNESQGGSNVSVGATAPNAPAEGDLWYNSDYGRLFVYYSDEDSDQWVDAAPFNFSGITTSTYTENSFIATEGQTTFNVTYDIGYVNVYLNGIRLTSTEYTASNGTSIVLSEAAAEGDVVDVLEIATNRGPTGAQGAKGDKGDTGASTRTVYSYTATGLTTTFSAVYNAGYIDVYRNGVCLTPNVDFVAINGSDFYLLDMPNEGDIIQATAYTNISITQVAVSSDTSPSLGGNLNLNSYNIIGTGNINIVGVITATSGNFSGIITSSGANISGVVTATDFNSTSDINLKTNIKQIDDPLAKVLQLNGVSFDWKHMNQSSAGVIAQDVEKVLPEIVRDAEDGYKSLNYNGLIGLLIEAVKEQNETIKSLEQKINTLEERLS